MYFLYRFLTVYLMLVLGKELSNTYYSGYFIGLIVALFLHTTREKKDE